MIHETITVKRYEPGDVLDLKGTRAFVTLAQKRRLLSDVRRGIVWKVNRLMTGELSYVLILDNGNQMRLKPDEQGAEMYLGHTDLSLLTGGETG